jgi:CBS domain-containing protein
MGHQQVKPIITEEQRKEFLYHLLNDVKALDQMVKGDLFEKNVQRIGAEQEFCIVSKNFRPSRNSLRILEKINDPHFTTELGLFNLEVNMDPVDLKKDCFDKLESRLKGHMNNAYKAADDVDNNKIILTGILPSLGKQDIAIQNMTPLDRYKTLNNVLKEIRGTEFRMLIKGVDELNIKSTSILFEACNTSFQVHFQIPLDEIIDKYNWAQVIAGPVLSSMTNSPLLLGRELWSETRIAVFQQSIDTRNPSYHLTEQKARVSFGNNWVKDSITDIYKDDITRYIALLTSDFEQDSMEVLKKGGTPKLRALNLHNSTVYKWNRLCYGITDGKPHLRIENRYIPSGPTIKDEIANAMFWVGLMQGIPDQYKKVWEIIPFNEARGNFINAARTGLDTYFNWFGRGISAKKLIKTILVPMSREGLLRSGVNKNSIEKYLEIIEKRVDNNLTGSKWMLRNYRKLKKEMTNDEASVRLTSGLYKRQMEGNPVYSWSPLDIEEGSSIAKMNDTLRKVMTTAIFVVQRDDLIELVKNIMQWKNIHHLPVVNKENKLVGVITASLIEQAEQDNADHDLLTVNNIMKKAVIRVDPDTTIEESSEIMKTYGIDCLPIIENEELIGIFTKSDLKRIMK